MVLKQIQMHLLWLFAQLTLVRAAFWTVTSNFQYEYSMATYGDYTYTDTRTMETTATPTGQPVSATTVESTYYDVEYVSAYYEPGAVDESDLIPTDADPYTMDPTGTMYYMNVTYTAPDSCTSSFTFETAEYVNVPSDVKDQVTGWTTVSEPASTYSDFTARPYESVYLSSGQAPFDTSTAFYYTSYVQLCSKPYDYSGGGSSGGGGGGYSGGGSYDYEVCSWYSGCTSLQTWVIIIAVLLPSLFLLGFLESYFWFRRLMIGKSCLRFGTVFWIMLSLWVACFTRKQSARSAEDQKLLREKWRQTSAGRAFVLWWKWGFKHRYPESLLGRYSRNTVGIVPPGAPGQPTYLPPGGQMYPPPAPGQPPVYVLPPQTGQQGQMYMAPMQPGQVMMQQQPGQPMMPQQPGQVMIPMQQGQYMVPQQPGQPMYPQMQQQQGQPMMPPAAYTNQGGVSPVAREVQSTTSPSPISQSQSPVPFASEKDGSTVTTTQSPPPR